MKATLRKTRITGRFQQPSYPSIKTVGYQGRDGEQGEKGDIGEGFDWLGVYSDLETYTYLDIVSYNGNIYFSVSETPITGINPTNPEWVVLYDAEVSPDVQYLRSTPMEISVGGAAIGTTFNGSVQDALDSILYPTDTPAANANEYVKIVAGENLAPYRIVYTDNNKVFLADKDNMTDRTKIIGITLNSENINNLIRVKIDGQITNPSWNLSPGNVYVGNSGSITQTKPTTGFVVQVGIVINPTSFLLDIDKVDYLGYYDTINGGTF